MPGRRARARALAGLLLAASAAFEAGAETPRNRDGSAGLEAVDLLLKWEHQFQFAGLYVADEDGHFRRQGLAVTLHTRKPGVDPVDEVLAGRMDYGISSASRLLTAHGQGLPVVVLGVVFQHSPLVLVSTDPTLRTPADLVGKRVGLADDDAEFLALLQREGIALDALQVVPHPLGLDRLVAGELDALTAYLTNEPFQLARGGRTVSVINPVDYGVRFYGDVLFTSRAEWTRRRDRALGLREAVFGGWDAALIDPERTIDRLAHRFPADKPRAELINEAAVIRGLIHPGAVPIGHSSNARWRQMQAHLAASGLIDGELSLDPLLEPVDDEIELRARQRLQWALIGLSLAGLLAAVHIVSLRLAVRRGAAALRRSHGELAEFNRVLEARIAERTRELAAERDLANALRQSRDQQLTQVTHELHSPLHGVLGNLSLLLEDGDRLTPETQRSLLQKVQRQARRLLRLVDHLLISAHLEAGTLSVHRESVDLVEETRQVIAEMAEDDPALTARVAIAAPPEPLRCSADRQRLRQMIAALIDNALRYSPADSRVEVSLARADDGHVLLDVGDSGPGIADADRERIFGRFVQGAASRNRAGGAGLGLSIARGLAAVHGGQLSMENRAGGGARFRLALPARPTASGR